VSAFTDNAACPTRSYVVGVRQGRQVKALLLSTLLLLTAQPSAPVERRAILNALRPVLETELRGRVQFVVTTLHVKNGWAFIQAEPQRPGGAPIAGELIFRDRWADMDGLTTTAILKRSTGGWRVVEWRIGATDAWYCGPLAGIAYDPCRD
jgi:hypothetical protein